MASVSSIYWFFPLFLRATVFWSLSYGRYDQFQDSMRSMLRSQDDTFDFIVVGSGSAGSVVANKLAQHFKVLLLEAGGQSSLVSAIPALTFPFYWTIPEDWKYETVPLKHSGFGLNNNISHWSAGKGLGGSSLINGMIYIRGTVQGFDTIAQETDDPIWKMENMLKYYKKIEDYHGFFDQDDSHGKGGRIVVQKPHLSPYVKNLMKAGEELGYKVRDSNAYGPLTEGFAPMELYIDQGLRWSAFNGYIKPGFKEPRLTIRKYSYGYKVILDENNVATGVEYLRHGKKQIAKATKEVILSAGAIQSPKILMLSGIGPKQDLERLGIRVRLDLPVGQRLQDKYGAFVGPFTINSGKSFVISRDFSMPEMSNFISRGKGPFSTSQAEATYSICSKGALAKGDYTPDIHAYIMSIPMEPALEKMLYVGSFNLKPVFHEKYLNHAYGKDSVMKLVTLNKPLSFGTLKLRDANPESQLLIDPNYLSDQSDVDMLIEAIKFSVKVMEDTKSMKEVGAKLLPMPIPGCEHVEFRSDAYWECLGRHTTGTAYKYCSTAPMGKDTSDPIAVVDSRLRVFGTKRLRIIDASVLQERYVSINHVTCTALGEVAAEFILDEYLGTGRRRSVHTRNF